MHTRIANVRRDATHKLARTFKVVGIEDLNGCESPP